MLVPARYNKPEEESPVIDSVDHYLYAIERHEPVVQKAEDPKKDEKVDMPKEPVKAVEQEPDTKPADVQKEVKVAKPMKDVKPHKTSGTADDINGQNAPSGAASN